MTVTAMPATAAEAAAEPGGAGSGKKKKLILIVGVVLAAAAVWFFVLAPKGPSEPKPGPVVALDAIQVNLADGHYLKIGIALQTAEGSGEVDGSKALDAVISTFSNRPISQVISSQGREKLRKELVKQLDTIYEDQVMGVYFTEFVTQ